MNWSKIITRSLIMNIQSENFFKPFNDKFDYERIQSYARETSIPLSTADNQLLTLLPHFHQCYKAYYAYLKKLQEKYKFTPSTLNQYLLALANREFITFFQVLPHYLEKKKNVHLQDLRNISIDSVFGNSLLGIEALETSIDDIDCIMSFYRYFSHGEVSSLEFDLAQIKEVYALTSHYIVIKNIFDSIIWENAYLKPSDKVKGQYHILYQEDYPIKKCIGLLRTRRFMEEEPIGDPEIMKMARFVYQKKSRSMEKRDKTYRIVDVQNGEIILKRGSFPHPISQEMIDEMGGRFYAMQANLFFAHYDKPIDFLYRMNIFETAMLFARLQALSKSVLKYYPQNGAIPNDELIHLAKYSYRIKESSLIDYLKGTTRFQERQIKRFLDLIVNQKTEKKVYGRFNSWRKMFIFLDGYYYFAVFPLQCCNICQLTEGWLEDCGLPLSGRGHEFERYCKERLRSGSGFVLKDALIDERTKYEVEGEAQEIDLVLVLKNYIVVGELKALSYPISSTGWHNAFKELDKGIEQAEIKSQFIAEYRHELLTAYPMADQKEIIPVVITNYPLYTGFNTKKIPVVDINLFYNILTNSPMRLKAVEGDHVKTVKETRFYENENDFIAQFKPLLFSPSPIEDLRRKIRYKEEPISLLMGHEISFIERHYYIEQDIDEQANT